MAQSARHFPIHRRGGRFAGRESANLTQLAQVLEEVESRYARTFRAISNNKLVRKWDADAEDKHMLNEIGLEGVWLTVVAYRVEGSRFFNLDVGNPVQTIEVDLDMLSPDFYSAVTSSGEGSKYDTFLAKSHVSGDVYVHAYCRLASDIFHIQPHTQQPMDWPVCAPSHSSRHTLSRSGTILGLAPFNERQTSTLSRLDISPFVIQLQRKSFIVEPIWSLTLLDSVNGVLSLGGTFAREAEEARVRTEAEMKFIGKQDALRLIEEEVESALTLFGSSTEDQFKWLDIHGADGWWMGLIDGIWVNGAKILKNQPFLIDLNCPFILAPHIAFRYLTHSIGQLGHLPGHFDDFAAVACANPPHIAFEMAGWTFPLTTESSRSDVFHGPAGGRTSIGKINDMVSGNTTFTEKQVNSGFCVSAIVGTAMGEKHAWGRSGMKNVWVLGEPFFRSLGIVFEGGRKPRMGLRSY